MFEVYGFRRGRKSYGCKPTIIRKQFADRESAARYAKDLVEDEGFDSTKVSECAA